MKSELLATLPPGVKLVAMTMFMEHLIVATENAVYRLEGDEFKPLRMTPAEGEPKP